MGRLVLLGRLDDALELLGSLGPDKGSAVLVIVANVVQEEILELAPGLMNTLG